MYHSNVNVNFIVENVIQIKSGITIKFRCDCKKHQICETDYIRNAATYNCENGKYIASIIVKSVTE